MFKLTKFDLNNYIFKQTDYIMTLLSLQIQYQWGKEKLLNL